MTTSLGVVRNSQRLPAVKNRHAHGRRAVRGLGVLCGLLVLGACDAAQPGASGSPTTVIAASSPATAQPEKSRMWMNIGEHRFAITLNRPDFVGDRRVWRYAARAECTRFRL